MADHFVERPRPHPHGQRGGLLDVAAALVGEEVHGGMVYWRAMTTATLPPPVSRQRLSLNEDDQPMPYWREAMSVDVFLSLPDDGIVREYINGHCYEYSEEYLMSLRNQRHCRAMTKVARHLDEWADTQGPPRGDVLTGDIGVQLRPKVDVRVGVDVVYLTPEHSAETPPRDRFVVGPPVLVVEILSGSDTVELARDKIQDFLAAGVQAAWLLDPYDHVVRIYRPGRLAEYFTSGQRIESQPYLPGFAVDVADLFSNRPTSTSS